MSERPIELLIVENNKSDYDFLRKHLHKSEPLKFAIDHADALYKGMLFLKDKSYDIIILNPSLPDSSGMETYFSLHKIALDAPIILYTSINEEKQAIELLREGAQDYLIKGQLTGEQLLRTIRYALEKQQTLKQLNALILVDELTGLFNRRGFLFLAKQHLKLARRTLGEVYLIFADLDDLKKINESCSHREGDLALVQTAKILKDAFRESDIIARIGGDEFAVLAVEAKEGSKKILSDRINNLLDLRNANELNSYKLNFCFSIVKFDPENPVSLEDLLDEADRLLYEEKKKKKSRKK